ncbi:MAG: hypothetical protein A2Z07_01690 [Armatimonadetes bacterium RBG_16_67_12]|nr:MAG: hypothetical protein A2Z07_01690 [Armatimonadetes bacterium RBG_16_67_12]
MLLMSRNRRPAGKSQKAGRRGGRKSLLLIAAVSFLALAGIFAVVALRTGPSPTRAQSGPGAADRGAPSGGRPALSVAPSSYDLGQISQARGIVTVEMAVTNTGDGDLEISEMETTCGCTRASLIVDGKTGPWYGMRGHGDWPTGWSARLRPGQRAALRVQYDPDAHGIYRGPVDRTVFIYSNDPQQTRAAVRLIGTQGP